MFRVVTYTLVNGKVVTQFSQPFTEYREANNFLSFNSAVNKPMGQDIQQFVEGIGWVLYENEDEELCDVEDFINKMQEVLHDVSINDEEAVFSVVIETFKRLNVISEDVANNYCNKNGIETFTKYWSL